MKKIILLGLTALLGACQSMTPAPTASLDGEVFYRQRIALPPTATLSVSLQDVLADAAEDQPGNLRGHRFFCVSPDGASGTFGLELMQEGGRWGARNFFLGGCHSGGTC